MISAVINEGGEKPVLASQWASENQRTTDLCS